MDFACFLSNFFDKTMGSSFEYLLTEHLGFAGDLVKATRAMFYKHLDLAKKMASEMMNGDYEESINTYDYFKAEVLFMVTGTHFVNKKIEKYSKK